MSITYEEQKYNKKLEKRKKSIIYDIQYNDYYSKKSLEKQAIIEAFKEIERVEGISLSNEEVLKLVEDEIERVEVDNIKSNSPLFVLIMTIIVTVLVAIIALIGELEIEALCIFLLLLIVYGGSCTKIYRRNNKNLIYLEALKEIRKQLKLL